MHALDSDGETKKEGKEEKGKKEEKKEGEEEEEKGFRLGPSDFLDSLKGGEKQFSGENQNYAVRIYLPQVSILLESLSIWNFGAVEC